MSIIAQQTFNERNRFDKFLKLNQEMFGSDSKVSELTLEQILQIFELTKRFSDKECDETRQEYIRILKLNNKTSFSLNTKKFNDFFEKVEKVFEKNYCVDICPYCNQPSRVISNPSYYHKCETCGEEYSYQECKTLTKQEAFLQLLNNFTYEK